MKKIIFTRDILPHLAAVLIFLVVTIWLFSPMFFDNKWLSQSDIRQSEYVTKQLVEYYKSTGKVALWASAVFSGMPAYLIGVKWSSHIMFWIKSMLSFDLLHPTGNIYLAFLSYYILLLAFRVRPFLALAGALAFGLSSYIVIGFGAGHNGRIGAIVFMPLIMAGIHLAFHNRKWLGFGLTALGMGLHFRENHLQMTYYLLFIVFIYGLIHLIIAIRKKQILPLFTSVGILIPAVLIAISCSVAPLWAVMEYSTYSIRGPSELESENKPAASGLSKEYTFSYSNGLAEPMTLLIPNFYGGSSTNFLVENTQSATYKALTKPQNAKFYNQLARYSTAYWGEQSQTAPYYVGAIIFFLFLLGIMYAERKYVWWLVSVSILGIVLSWGSSFSSFNDLMFAYFPGYNKFRSVTFALVMTMFSMPLLGLLGLNRLLEIEFTKEVQKKIFFTVVATGGLCFIFWLFAGMRSFVREGEYELPIWLVNALVSDRKDMFRQDALRSLAFIAIFSTLLFFTLKKKISYVIFSVFFVLISTVDLFTLDRRYFNDKNFAKKYVYNIDALPVDTEILKDKDYYRVYDIREPWAQDARTAYFHNSINGYNAAKLRRYQEFYDSCFHFEIKRFFDDARQGSFDFNRYLGLDMLNVKYIVFGSNQQDFMQNPRANGNGWFVKRIKKVNSPTAELQAVCDLTDRLEAVIDVSKFKIHNFGYDSLGTISIEEFSPSYLRYASSHSKNGVAVFSEIFYPEGWHAFIDGKEVPILRANYILRALEIPSGNHKIELKFEPNPYVIGDKVMLASSWTLIILVLGSLGMSIKKYV